MKAYYFIGRLVSIPLDFKGWDAAVCDFMLDLGEVIWALKGLFLF